MSSVAAQPAAGSAAAELPPDAITLVIPLRAKDGLGVEDFYAYWLNAHVTLPARFPGIISVWLHQVSLEDVSWPEAAGVSGRPGPEGMFHGVPDATFPTREEWAFSSRPRGCRWRTALTSFRR
jgi:hypothetical protein